MKEKKMSNNTDYEKLYFELTEALGYNSETIKEKNLQEKIIEVAKIYGRVRMAMLTSKPEESGTLFVCGIGGKQDDMGLPERLHVCPTYGLQGVAIYEKIKEYDEPGW